MNKGVVLLLGLLTVALGLTACGGGGGGSEEQVKIGVVGPMSFVQGEHHWYGAKMAADEINAAGGIKVGDKTLKIKLVKVDTNEMNSVQDAASAAEKALTVDDVDYLVGGFRSEAVLAMQEIAMDNKTLFLGAGASDPELCDRVKEDYDRFKYWFRVTPVNSNDLGRLDFLLLKMVGDQMKQELGIAKPKVAILAEKASWADAIVDKGKGMLALLGMESVGEWRPSPTATDVSAELSAIERSGAQIIFTSFSGPVGIPYARRWGELKIPAASVGINVEAQKQGFWDATGGKGDYEMTLNTYAAVKMSPRTIPFVEKFVKETGELPTYNAGTYEAVYLLKEAIEKAGAVESEKLIPVLEDMQYETPSGKIVFTETHDVTWGPGFVTGIGVQWQNGDVKCVWPLNWEGVTYEGAVKYQIPPWVVEKWKQ